MRRVDRYKFIKQDDHTVIVVTQKGSKAQNELLFNHDDAEIIERQGYDISFGV